MKRSIKTYCLPVDFEQQQTAGTGMNGLAHDMAAGCANAIL